MVCIMLQMFRLTLQCYPVANNVLNVEFLKSIRSNVRSALIGTESVKKYIEDGSIIIVNKNHYTN